MTFPNLFSGWIASFFWWMKTQNLLWKDRIQENDVPMWGFDGISTATGGVAVASDDANGVNLSRVPDPAGGPGFCLRHYADLSQSGAYVRSQACATGAWHKEISDAADKGCYFEHECYLPKSIGANNDGFSWLALLDLHVVGRPEDDDRSYLGLLVEPDGSMRASLIWNGKLNAVNRDVAPTAPISTVKLPVGRWFKIRTYFKRTTEPSTIRVWFDNELALEWRGVINSLSTNVNTEYYVKLYAGVQHDNPWGKVVRYSRNARIWR